MLHRFKLHGMYPDNLLLIHELLILCLFEGRHMLPGHYRVTDEALLAETT